MRNSDLIVTLGISEDGFPVTLDFNNSANLNMLLCGRSGEGKTVQAQNIIRQLAQQGETILACNLHGALDDDQLFPPFREAFNAFRNDIAAHDSGIPLGFFQRLEFPDGSMESVEDTAGATSDMISRTMKFGVDQRAILRAAIEGAFKCNNGRTATFSDVAQQLQGSGIKSASKLYERLRFLFTRDLFIEGHKAITPGRINVIQLGKFDLEVQEVIQELVLSYIWRLANTGRFKEHNLWLFIDEVQNVNAESNGSLARMISEGRKMGVNLILATQMVLQGKTNSVQQRLPQAGLMLFYKPAANRMGLTAKMISPGDADTWALRLKNLRIGEFVATGNYCIGGLPINYPVVINARQEDINPV